MVKKRKKKAKTRSQHRKQHRARDSGGLFAKGNKIAVGNKGNTSNHAKALKDAFIVEFSIEDIKDIAKNLKVAAKNSNIKAISEIFDRLWGKAKQETEVSGQINFAILARRTVK